MYINDLNVSSVQRDPKKNLLGGFKGHLALSRLRSLIQAEQNLQAVAAAGESSVTAEIG